MKKSLKYSFPSPIIVCLILLAGRSAAQFAPDDNPQAKAIVAAMQKSAEEWNKGDLADFMLMYDPSATMMMPGGTASLDSIRSLYRHKYFKGSMPKQNLKYSDMKVRLLGENYALLTGAFTLHGNGLPERSGRYSLVMVRSKSGWRILHDHSS
jgi:uncharacterized protein (TIGR02246 family)